MLTTGRRKESSTDLNIILIIFLGKAIFLVFCKDTGDRKESLFLLKVYNIIVIDFYNLARALYQKYHI